MRRFNYVNYLQDLIWYTQTMNMSCSALAALPFEARQIISNEIHHLERDYPELLEKEIDDERLAEMVKELARLSK